MKCSCSSIILGLIPKSNFFCFFSVDHDATELMFLSGLFDFLFAFFKQYDRKGDGHIPLKELKDTLVRETSHELPEHAVRKIIAKADLNQDGYIQFPEFLSLVESKEGRIVMDSVFRRYIKSTIPPRKSRKTRHDLTDGEYEDEYTCNPPAVCMLIVSIIEVRF